MNKYRWIPPSAKMNVLTETAIVDDDCSTDRKEIKHTRAQATGKAKLPNKQSNGSENRLTSPILCWVAPSSSKPTS